VAVRADVALETGDCEAGSRHILSIALAAPAEGSCTAVLAVLIAEAGAAPLLTPGLRCGACMLQVCHVAQYRDVLWETLKSSRHAQVDLARGDAANIYAQLPSQQLSLLPVGCACSTPPSSPC